MALITNGSAINFGMVNQGQSITVTHASVILSDDTKADIVLWTGSVNNQRVLVPGDPIQMPIGDLDIEIPPGSLVDASLVAILNEGAGDYNQNWEVRLGTAAMTATGKANQPDGATGYTAQTNQTLTIQTS